MLRTMWLKFAAIFKPKQLSTTASRKVVANFKLNASKHPKSCFWNKVTSTMFMNALWSIYHVDIASNAVAAVQKLHLVHFLEQFSNQSNSGQCLVEKHLKSCYWDKVTSTMFLNALCSIYCVNIASNVVAAVQKLHLESIQNTKIEIFCSNFVCNHFLELL